MLRPKVAKVLSDSPVENPSETTRLGRKNPNMFSGQPWLKVDRESTVKAMKSQAIREIRLLPGFVNLFASERVQQLSDCQMLSEALGMYAHLSTQSIEIS